MKHTTDLELVLGHDEAAAGVARDRPLGVVFALLRVGRKQFQLHNSAAAVLLVAARDLQPA